WNFKFFRQMRGERFYTENFGGVMSTEQKIHAELFSRHGGPVRRFASDKGVDIFLRDPVDLRARAAGHNADHARLFWANIENFYGTIQYTPQFTNEIAARRRDARFQPDRLAFFFQKRLRRFESKRFDELRIVANFRMDIQRKVRAVERDIVFKGNLQLPAQRVSHRLQAGPEQTVMHDQKIDVCLCRLSQNARGNIDCRAEPRDSA